jgi:hypothetical protein
LPIIPIPLLPEDEEVLLDLQKALAAVYEEAAYHLSIDYKQAPPPPALSEAEQDWVSTIISGF